jgi:protease I
MKLTGKKIAVLVEADYQDMEVWFPIFRLREEGAEVVVVGTGSNTTYRGKYGYPITVDFSADQVHAEQFHGVVIPGGWAPDRLRQYKTVLDFVRKLFESGKPVAAICHAGSVLVSADLVRGKHLTSFNAIKDDLKNAGANWEDKEVVLDGNLVTSRRPDDLPAFMRAFIGLF